MPFVLAIIPSSVTANISSSHWFYGFVSTSHYMVCRAIMDQLPEENLNSLVID